MNAKEGFAKNVAPNNVTYSDTGEVMHKWKSATYWGTNESRGTSCTVNEKGFDFKACKIIKADEDGFAFAKHDFDEAAKQACTNAKGKDVVDLCASDDDEEECGGGGASASTGLRGLHEQQQKQHLAQVKQELSVAEQEREAAQSRLQCTVCMEVERNTVLLPCSHVVACAGCATRLTQCPVCRAAIHSRVMARMS